MLVFVPLPASAQVQTGTPPFGSFGGGPDVINLANLNSHLTVPVLHKPGRGTSFTYDLSYDSSAWYPVGSGGSQSWQPRLNLGWASSSLGGYITYNLAGELTSITYPSGRIVQQNVDTIGRLSSIVGTFNSVNTTYASGFAYNSAFQTTGLQYGNGIFASFGFSADRLLLNCLDYSTTSRGGSCAHDATTKFGLNYSYPVAGSNNGQIAGITDSVDNGRSASYGYDALYRLTSAVTTGSAAYPQWGLSETYDRYGNRTAQTVTAGSGPSNSVSVDATTNHIATAGYVYDANGNMTNDGNNTLVYDAENRTVSATNGGASGAYTFDGNSLRVKKVSGATTTVYIFSGSKVIAEYYNGAAPGSPSREYIYSGSTLLAKIDSSGTNYYHQDHLSNRLVTNSSGTTVAQLAHFPFGEHWYNASNDKLLFTSYERDSESGNDYAMMRSYVNRLARFSSPDPLSGSTSDPQSLNKYAYVRGDPINLADPTGLGYCFGYWVILVTENADTGEIISREVLGFIPIYCWGDGDGGGAGGDGGGGGSSSGVSERIKQIIKAALGQPKLAECLNKIFGPGTILTNANLPKIDTTVPQAEISRRTGTRADATIRTPVPSPGRGTVLIATEVFHGPDTSPLYLQATYVHETGNILAKQRLGDWNARPSTDPNLRAFDHDTGMNLEDCVFGGAVALDGSVTRNPQ